VRLVGLYNAGAIGEHLIATCMIVETYSVNLDRGRLELGHPSKRRTSEYQTFESITQ
jgi:hypothetical protein